MHQLGGEHSFQLNRNEKQRAPKRRLASAAIIRLERLRISYMLKRRESVAIIVVLILLCITLELNAESSHLPFEYLDPTESILYMEENSMSATEMEVFFLEEPTAIDLYVEDYLPMDTSPEEAFTEMLSESEQPAAEHYVGGSIAGEAAVIEPSSSSASPINVYDSTTINSALTYNVNTQSNTNAFISQPALIPTNNYNGRIRSNRNISQLLSSNPSANLICKITDGFHEDVVSIELVNGSPEISEQFGLNPTAFCGGTRSEWVSNANSNLGAYSIVSCFVASSTQVDRLRGVRDSREANRSAHIWWDMYPINGYPFYNCWTVTDATLNEWLGTLAEPPMATCPDISEACEPFQAATNAVGREVRPEEYSDSKEYCLCMYGSSVPACEAERICENYPDLVDLLHDDDDGGYTNDPGIFPPMH
jgi:hypothetical protein